jgi:hypothetical protein
MSVIPDKKKIFRVLDANLNRSKEALRVCEDIARFVLNQKKATASYRSIRHSIEDLRIWLEKEQGQLIEARDIHCDVGKKNISTEFKRCHIRDIFYANSQRVKESLRVLEEFFKVTHVKAAEQCKRDRYSVYALEQSIIKKL